jgi:predicted small secreted protein
MTRMRIARRRLAPALVIAGSLLGLAACHTVGDTMSGIGTGVGQDLRATGNFINGGPAKPQTPPPAGTAYAPGTMPAAGMPAPAAGPYPQPAYPAQ